MAPEKYFSILVKGILSSDVEEGELNKDSGLPVGPTTKVKIQIGGIAIPNFSKVWAKRIKDKKDQPTGELEFLKWNTPGGESVQIRYLEGINTLDKVYQTTVLKMIFSEEEQNQIAYINLDIGVNDFDVAVADPMLLEMLRHHTYNGDNESRNPNSSEVHFNIYDPKKLNSGKIGQMKLDQRANDIVMSAEQDSARLEILAGMFELDPRAQEEVLFNELLEILDDNKKKILDVVDHHKTIFNRIITKLEDSGDLDYTDTDVVLTMDHNRVPFGMDIPTKNIKLYMVDNILDPDCHAVYQRLLEIDKKLVEQLN